jgi:hypothetical protein
MFLFFLVLDAVVLPMVAIKGVHWAKDGAKFAHSVDGCNATYMAKYKLVQHFQAHHNVTMELSKPKRLSTQE